MPPFQTVLVANRGEIAVRVMAACEELGIETVAVYSDADVDAGHVAYADEAYNVGPAPARDSYLDGDAILDAADRAGADAIHPGYGFLAENAGFARRVEESDATWVGPGSEAMERLGEKTRARRAMEDAGVPIVPGTTEPVESATRVREFGEEYGFPVAIKAAGGGGGRGLEVVGADDDVEAAFESSRREGEAYFDDPTVYVEKYLEAPKHVEVQILADEHGTVLHLGERDCSLQRRHQKLVEEAPSPALDDDLRREIGEAARAGVRAADYTNAGTVEFLVEDGRHYFMEVNTRIQVEHTVTEEVTGIDVVREQLRVAAGEALPYEQSDVTVEGHAMEFRINAEDPAEGFSPSTGTLGTYDPPGGIGVRVDDAVVQGDTVTGDYDSMIAKLVVSAPTRERCLARSERTLRHFEVAGPETTIPFHRLMLEDETFRAGEHTTAYVDEAVNADDLAAAVERWGSADAAGAGEPPVSRSELAVEVDGRRYEVRVVDGLPRSAPGTARQDEAEPSADPSGAESASDSEPTTAGGNVVAAEMQGTVLAVNVAPGDDVSPGDVLCVLEAMKMENDVAAPTGGTVAEVPVAAGDSVDMGDPLVVFE